MNKNINNIFISLIIFIITWFSAGFFTLYQNVNILIEQWKYLKEDLSNYKNDTKDKMKDRFTWKDWELLSAMIENNTLTIEKILKKIEIQDKRINDIILWLELLKKN